MGIFTYFMGLGIYHYLAGAVKWPVALLGLLLMIALLFSRSYLKAFFRFPELFPSMEISRIDQSGDLKLVETKEVPKHVLLQMALASLGLGAIITIILLVMQAIAVPLFIILSLSLALILLEALPPVQLGKKGFSELIEAILIANTLPATAFLLQMRPCIT